ncbi:type VI secretion system baseplate subunit TssG [Rubrivirga sp.]|uniref:type VI secretion system baseplate subunit TssG n=1 Tax=Rubrivirga sp. TaxID=1885344 RepID=UPI003B52506C
METPDPIPPPGPPERLFREGYLYDFFQAVRLLERDADGPAIGTTADARAEPVRIRPSDALTFPGADVRRIERRPDGSADVVVTFGGLYGVDSPLAPSFHEPVTTDPSRTAALRDFLDLFAGRLYAYLYRAWRKARPEVEPEVPARDARRFAALAGAAQAAPWTSPAPPLQLAAFAGRLSDRRRTADGLRALAEAFVGAPVRVIENVPRWMPVPTRPSLGPSGPRLGANAPLGARVLDLTGKIRLQVGPVGMDQFQDLLPGGDGARTLAALVRLYARDSLSCEVELVLDAAAVRPTMLGDGLGQMGRTAFVGRPRGTDVRRVATYDAADA